MLDGIGDDNVAYLLGQNGFGRSVEWFWRDEIERTKQAWGVLLFPESSSTAAAT